MLVRLTPDFTDYYTLLNEYSYEFLEPYIHQLPQPYKSNTTRPKQTRKNKVRSYKEELNCFYGVKGSIGEYNMYGYEIAPYKVCEVHYHEEHGTDRYIILQFFSVDDLSMRVLLPIDNNVERLFKGVFEYLELYSQLQDYTVFETHFNRLCDSPEYDYN